MLAGFSSEQVAGFILECMAGFVGIRTVSIDTGMSFVSLCRIMHRNLAAAYAEGGALGEERLETLRMRLRQQELYALDPVFVWVDEADVPMTASDFRLEPIPYWHEPVRFDLRIEVHRRGQELTLVTEYRNWLFEKSEMEKLQGNLVNLLRQIPVDMSRSVLTQ
jgi:hypothetical protein